MKPSTAVLGKQNRTIWEYFNLIQRTDFMGKCFFKRAIALWNTLPESIKTKNMLMLLLSKKVNNFLPGFSMRHLDQNLVRNVGAPIR